MRPRWRRSSRPQNMPSRTLYPFSMDGMRAIDIGKKGQRDKDLYLGQNMACGKAVVGNDCCQRDKAGEPRNIVIGPQYGNQHYGEHPLPNQFEKMDTDFRKAEQAPRPARRTSRCRAA